MTHALRPVLLAGAFGLAALAGCQKPATTVPSKAAADGASIERALRDDETQWNADYKARAAAKVAAHYAPDGTLMTPGNPVISGTDALDKGAKDLVADPALDMHFSADKVGVSESGDLAYTRGSFKLTVTDPTTRKPVTLTGSYVTVYKKQPDGSWKAVEDIATPTLPPAASAAPPKAG
jgi:ketosteroid isomerase-like protein